MMNATRKRLVIAAFILGPALAACDPAPPRQASVEIIRFEADRSVVAAGGAVKLSWEVGGDVESIELFRGATSLARFEATEATGSFEATAQPPGLVGYELYVSGKDGSEARHRVEVEGVLRPTIGSFRVDRDSVASGSTVVLSWETALADRISIESDTGALVGRREEDEAGRGALQVRVDETTEYTLTAEGIGGRQRARLTVSVLARPAFTTLEATPTAVLAGEDVMLRWVTTNATSLTFRGAGGRVLFAAEESSVGAGSRTIALDATTVLDAELSGPGGTSSRTLVVNVTPRARFTQFYVDPPHVILGEPVRLSWSSVGIEEIAISANGVPYEGCEPRPNGACEIPDLFETTLFEITGVGTGGTAHGELLVEVHGIPLIERFEADRTTVHRNRAPATLSWRTHNGVVLSLADDFGNVVDTSGRNVGADSLAVRPNETTNYTLTLVGPGGIVQQRLPTAITVDDPAPYVELTAARSQIVLGTTTNLSWRVTDHTSFTLEALEEGSDTPVPLDVTGRAAEDEFTLNPPPGKTTTFTLRAIGSRPELVTTARTTVTVVRLPEFRRFETTKPVVTRGAEYELVWETEFADGVETIPPRAIADTDPYVTIRGRAETVTIRLPEGASGDTFQTDVHFPGGFLYPFFGIPYSSVRFATDGYLCFGGSSECDTSVPGNNQTFPDGARPNNLIAPFWDDLRWGASTELLWRIDGAAPHRKMTFEWHEMGMRSSDGERLSFQAVLFEDGTWELRNAPRPPPTGAVTNPGSNLRWGTSATIGVEGPGGGGALLVSANDSTASALCSAFTPGTGSTMGSCTPLTRLMRERLGPDGRAGFKAPTGGEAAVFHRMRAFGPSGEATSPEALVRVVPPAEAAEFTVTRLPAPSGSRPMQAHIGEGETVHLFWSVTPTTGSVVREYGIRNGVTGENEPNVAARNGQVAVSPTETTTYTLYARNEADDETTKTITVRVEPPEVSLAVDRDAGPAGDSFTFTWTSSGASRLQLEDPDGVPLFAPLEWARVGEQARIRSGSQQLALTRPGTYTLRATNGSGTSTATVAVDVVTETRLVSFEADRTEQTAGVNVVLTWETFNATSVSIARLLPDGDDDDAPDLELLPGMPIDAPGMVRRGSHSATMLATDTTFVLIVNGADGEVDRRQVTVTSVPAATITQFVSTRPILEWNQQTTLRWTTENATTLRLYTLVGSGATAIIGSEVTAARDRVPAGEVTLTLMRTTGFRIEVTNRLGTKKTTDLDPEVTVHVSPPALTEFVVEPGDSLPSGGFATVRWSATQAENVYLWQREPEDVLQGATSTPATSTPPSQPLGRTESVNVPYDYVPYDFVDISSTGAPLAIGFGADATKLTPNHENGYAIVDFPVDFRPHFFGEDMGRMLVSAEGGLFLAPPGAPDSFFDGEGASTVSSSASCRTTTASTTCGTLSPGSFASNSATRASNRIFPFFSNLSGRSGCTTAEGCSEGRAPGTIYWQLLGAAPQRMLVVQWDRWDASTPSNSGVFTFQTKLYENGDVEFQYKTLQSASTAFQRGGSALVGVEKRGYKGLPVNYFLGLASGSSQFLNAGDGYRIYCGRQPAQGRIRTFYATTVSEGTPAATRFPFRGVVTNSRDTENRSSVRVAPLRVVGQNDLFINELMIDPDPLDDTNKEWIEILNRSSTTASLAGFTIQTSSGSYQFAGGDIPGNSVRVLGQSASPLENGGVPVDVVYGNGVRMDDVADTVVLRFGSILVDRVEYDASAGWRVPRGRSLALDPNVPTGGSHLLNDPPDAWCGGRDPTGLDPTRRSTPREPNAGCYGMELIAYDSTYDISMLPAEAVTIIHSVGHGSDEVRPAPLLLPGFRFFGREADPVLQVGADGWVALSGRGSGVAYTNVESLPSLSDPAHDGLYVFHDDLSPVTGRGRTITALVGEAPNRAQVIMWDGYKSYGGLDSSDYTFMAVLKEDDTVEYHYKSLVGPNADGRSTTIGWEANGNTLGGVWSASTSVNPPAIGPPTPPAALRPRRFD